VQWQNAQLKMVEAHQTSVHLQVLAKTVARVQALAAEDHKVASMRPPSTKFAVQLVGVRALKTAFDVLRALMQHRSLLQRHFAS
jgi:hypothetical protein